MAIIYFRVFTEHMGQIVGQGAVHINRQPGNLFFGIQLMQHIQQLLCPPEGKGWDQNAAAAFGRFCEHAAQPRFEIDHRLVVPVAVGAFYDQQIDLPVLLFEDEGRIAQNWLIESTDVTGVANRLGDPVFIDRKHRNGRAEDVAGIIQRCDSALSDRYRVAVRETLKMGQRLPGICGVVQGLDAMLLQPIHQLIDRIGVEMVSVFFQHLFYRRHLARETVLSAHRGFHLRNGRPQRFVVQVSCIRFLDLGRVKQQMPAGGCRGARAAYPAAEAVFCQQRDSAGMIDVGM